MRFFAWLLLPSSLVLGQSVDFSRQVHPILVSRCLSCHTGDRGQAGLSVGTRDALVKGGVSGSALVPGNAAKSPLVQRLKGLGGQRMPLAGAALSESEIGLIERWVNEGAVVNAVDPGQRSFSLALKPPPAKSLDEVLAAYQRQHQITPPAPVSDSLFARRAYLDLWGLLPTPAEQARFVNDTRPGKRALLVDELLAVRQPYAEHWVSFWNDLLHNDEGVTYIGERQTITPWLLKSLRENRPYHEFVQALLSPIAPDDPAGFLKGVNWRGTVNASQTPVMQAAQNSAQVFLGVNLKCNSCHDSFISHWKLKEAYGLASFFANDLVKEPLEVARCDSGTGVMASPQFLFPELGGVEATASLVERRAAAARLFTAKENGLFSRTIVNRIWKRLLGHGLVEPADEMESPAWSPELLDWLAADFVAHKYDLHHLLRRIMTSAAYSLPAVPAGQMRDTSYVFRGPWPRRLTAEQFSDAISSITGEWRIRADSRPVPGVYAREWRFKPNSLTRALGRPMRDGAVTERLTESSTLQGMELANGEVLTTMLREGAKRLLDQVDAAPTNLFDSGLLRAQSRVKVDIDVTGRKQLRLLMVDVDSYDPARVEAGWGEAELEGPSGKVPLSSLRASAPFKQATFTLYKDKLQLPVITSAIPNELVFDIAGKGYTRFRALLAMDDRSNDSEINPAIRAFVFDETPNERKLVAVTGDTPLPRPTPVQGAAKIVAQLYQHAVGRAPTADEARIAVGLLGEKPTRQGLEDLLWTVFLSPEFQFVR
ncbi:MAG: DUF1549 domain-containing protein [Bryobacteraceae bacterium]|nr:DUF1549 domain-containing protein [Bryobacteraceae bacterium]